MDNLNNLSHPLLLIEKILNFKETNTNLKSSWDPINDSTFKKGKEEIYVNGTITSNKGWLK